MTVALESGESGNSGGSDARPSPKPAVAAKPPTPIWKRCLTGSLAVLVLSGVILLDRSFSLPWISVTAVFLFGVVGAFEVHRLLGHIGYATRVSFGVVWAASLLALKTAALVGWIDWLEPRGLIELVLGLGLIGAFAREVVTGEPPKGLQRVLANLVSIGVVWLFSALLDLLLRPASMDNVALTFLVLFVAKAADIGGYLAGSFVGGRKLAPAVSPKKTWAGAVGGTLLSLAVAIAGGRLVGLPAGPAALAVLGIAVSVAAQFGDLGESLLKRACGRKDSSDLVPTFGGALDMIDSLVFAAPVGYWTLNLLDVVN